MINLTATFHAKTGQEQQLEELLVAMLAPTRQEPGNKRYCLFKNKDDAAIFTFQEQFADQIAFDEHCKQPYFIQLLASLDGLLDQEPKITFLEELSA
ncbi:putative quinol monooxygenase [Vibrio ouci]|uniref:Antibiotic biosynthesis monooxygenase n=1 Tax=Vibrio ouci TaxID=2499078 RepID=A0A4Y8WFV3_9VIBR|nr:putative quinol monooxygenase [Vibrio ouci]TFH91171.1 antibiotic biosynthesis monooxygenase [Vibrio ouci]